MVQEFAIPVTRDDLLNRTGVNQYCVDEVLSERHLPTALQGVKSALRGRGAATVVDHFDTLFSVLCLKKRLDAAIKEEAWTLTLNICSKHVKELSSVLSETALDVEVRGQHLLSVKMSVYLLCQLVEMYEAEDTKPTLKQTGRGKKDKNATVFGIDWENERYTAVSTLLNLVRVNLNRLWDPPIAEDDFVNLVTCCCYKMLENPGLNRCKETRDTILNILGVMVKRYNHALGASLKISQLLQHFEHLVSPMAQAVELFSRDYGVNSVAAEIIREIGRMDSKDLERDNSGTRTYAAFLVDLSERIPAVILPNVSVLLSHLEGESYTMCNGVLGSLAEILIQVLSKDELPQNQKATRDQILDILEDCIHDENAFVRSKVLQIWLKIINQKCLPIQKQSQLSRLVIGRLEDTSSLVRKHAICVVTTLLKSNPFAAKLSVEELKASYEKEKEKLEELESEVTPEQQQQNEALDKMEDEWSALEPELQAALNASSTETDNEKSESADTEEDTDDLTVDSETSDTALSRLVMELTNGKYARCIKLFDMIKDAWPDMCYFESESNTDHADNSNDEEEAEDESAANTPAKTMQIIKAIFVDQKCPVSSIAQNLYPEACLDSQEDEAVVELRKQQTLVRYLQDTLSFASLVQTAIPIICQLLTSQILSDVMESVEFFVSAFEFGVSNSIIGVRKMLLNVWSKEAGIKEAVVNAYKRLYLSPEGGNARSKAAAIVQNLTALQQGASMADLMAIDVLVGEFYKSGEISGTVIQVLWERFTQKLSSTTAEESRLAVQLLSMVAGEEPDIVRSNIDVLVNNGLGERGAKDLQLARDTCLALQKLGTAKRLKGSVAAEPFRLPYTHDLFTRLVDILVRGVIAHYDGANQSAMPRPSLAKLHTSTLCSCCDGSIPAFSESKFPENYTGILVMGSDYWIPLAEQAVNVIYKLSEHPDLVCADIIRQLAEQVISSKDVVTPPNTQEEESGTTKSREEGGPASTGEVSQASSGQTGGTASQNNGDSEGIWCHGKANENAGNVAEDKNEGQENADTQGTDENSQEAAAAAPTSGQTQNSQSVLNIGSPTAVLTGFIAFVGHTALKHLIHLDVSVFGELKRRNACQEQKSVSDYPTSVSDSVRKSKQENVDCAEEEMGLAAAEDAEVEYIKRVCEQALVTGGFAICNLLASLAPVIINVCQHGNKFRDPRLRTAATHALSKFMIVSSQFCEEHLQLLFTILEKASSPEVRAVTISALGDLSVRFPNLIEPWTPHLYARLRDDSAYVRKTTLHVLTHLILNDMIKVKGQISEMATCIVDDDDKISGLSMTFFRELSKKGNAVYNIMPDIISRLSDPDIGLDQENFRTIMDFLFSFIQKDKQCESLVEKLCHRYRFSRTDRQWRDLSYCLSLLSYNEKSLRKLHENFAFFGDKLSDEDVYHCFCKILSKTKKGFAKQDVNSLLEELGQKIELCHTKGMDDEEVACMASQMSAAGKQGKTPSKSGKTPRKAGKTPARRKHHSGDSVNDDYEDKTPAPKHRTRGGRKVFEDSDDDSDPELFKIEESEKENEVDENVDGESTRTKKSSRSKPADNDENIFKTPMLPPKKSHAPNRSGIRNLRPYNSP